MNGSELRNLRKRLGLTQKDIAGEIDVNPNTVARWERGESPISENFADRILNFAMSSPTDIETIQPHNKALDEHHRKILQKLDGTLDPVLFEQCAVELIGLELPGVVHVGGVQDNGFDGAIAAEYAVVEPTPLIVTTSSDPRINLRKSLQSINRSSSSTKRACFATSHRINASDRNKLNEVAARHNFTLIQIFDQSWFASRLYRNSNWCFKLLGVTGQPSALSKYPTTNRPQLSQRIFGREKEIQWLLDRKLDCLVEGGPGSGKTSLLQTIVNRRKAYFLSYWDPQQVANNLRDYQPAVIVIDDAHIQLETLEALIQLRNEINTSDVQIFATAWPSGSNEVMSTLNLVGNDKLELGDIDADTMVEIVTSMGIEKPELLREIRQQAAGKPGLTVTLADICRRGEFSDIQNVVSGNSLADKLLQTLERTLQIDDADRVLSAFAIGGKSGMLPEKVAEYFNCSILEIQTKLAKVATAGVIRETHERNISVVPQPLQRALVHRIFFNHPPTPDYTPLLQMASNQHDSLEVLIHARAIGANIPSLESHIANSGSVMLWCEYAWLGRSESEFVLERHPEIVLEIAEPALVHAPEKTIPLLLNEVGSQMSSFSFPPIDNAMEKLVAWAVYSSPYSVDVLARRVLLVNAAAAWLQQNIDNNVETAIRAMLIALRPNFRHSSIDPGKGTVLTIHDGVLGIRDLEELTNLWPKVFEVLHAAPNIPWKEIFEFTTEWTHPHPNPAFQFDEETEATIKKFLVILLRDLNDLARKSLLARSRIREIAHNAEIHLNSEFVAELEMEVLLSLRNEDKWDLNQIETELFNLAEIWKKRNAKDIAELFQRVHLQHIQIYDSDSWMLTKFSSYLASCVSDPLVMARAVKARNLPSGLIRSFSLKASEKSERGWKQFAMQCLESEKYRSIGIEMIIINPTSTTELVSVAIHHAAGMERVIRICCQQLGITQNTLNTLLCTSDKHVAVAAAIGHWFIAKHQGTQDCLNENWPKAVLRSANYWEGGQGECYELQSILMEDIELAADWLCNLVSSDKSPRYLVSKIAIAIIEKLEFDQKLKVLRNIGPNFGESKIVQHVVGNNLNLYRVLLNSDYLSRHHLAPLRNISEESWTRKALLALENGKLTDDIVSTPNVGNVTRYDRFSERSENLLNYFEKLRGDPDTRLRRIAERGVEYYKKQRKWELEIENYHNVHGF